MNNCPTCSQPWPFPPFKCWRCGVEYDEPAIEPFGTFYITDPARPTVEATLPATEDVWLDVNGTEQRRLNPGRVVTLPRKMLVCHDCWLEDMDRKRALRCES